MGYTGFHRRPLVLSCVLFAGRTFRPASRCPPTCASVARSPSRAATSWRPTRSSIAPAFPTSAQSARSSSGGATNGGRTSASSTMYRQRSHAFHVCPTSFKQRTMLTAHPKLHADGGSLYKCHECGEGFGLRCPLSNHLWEKKHVAKPKRKRGRTTSSALPLSTSRCSATADDRAAGASSWYPSRGTVVQCSGAIFLLMTDFFFCFARYCVAPFRFSCKLRFGFKIFRKLASHDEEEGQNSKLDYLHEVCDSLSG